jgi:hypothetical protein
MPNLPPSYDKLDAITKSDTVDMPLGPPAAIYVGGAGVVALVFLDNTVVNVTAIAGAFLPFRGVKRVNSTNTTATVMVACYQF